MTDGLACRRGARTLFSDLSFVLHSGEIAEIRGPNGSGKTSLLRMLAGFLPPLDGSIRFEDGRDAIAKGVHSVNYLGHSLALKSALTVRENVAQWARLIGSPDRDTVERALEVFRITALAELPLRYLSQGQKRRTALCRLITGSRPVWLLDEPNVGLDSAASDILANVMGNHLQDGGIILAASHIDLGLTPTITIRMEKGAAHVE